MKLNSSKKRPATGTQPEQPPPGPNRLQPVLSAKNSLWPSLFLELAVAVSLCMAYFFLVQLFAVGVPHNSTNLWVFSSCSTVDFHLKQLYDVWKGRLIGLLFTGYLFDSVLNGATSLNIEQYNHMFAAYQSGWLFALFLVVILTFRQSLFINLGIFAGLIYDFSPVAGYYFYPWDISSTLFFTVAVIFFARKQPVMMIVAIIFGCLYKEADLVCAVLILMVDRWKWPVRIALFVGIFVVYSLIKELLTRQLHVPVAAFSMHGAKHWSDLLKTWCLTQNLGAFFSLTLNHVIFVNAGSTVAVLVLCWQRRYWPYMLLIGAFLAGSYVLCIVHEYRNFMQILPLSIILLSERWQVYMNRLSPSAAPLWPRTESEQRPQNRKPGTAHAENPVAGLRSSRIFHQIINYMTAHTENPFTGLRPASIWLSLLTGLLIFVSIAVAGSQFFSLIHRLPH